MSSLECKNLAEQLIRISLLNKFGLNSNAYSYTNQNLFNLHITNLGRSENTKRFLDLLFGIHLRSYYPNVIFHQKALEEIFSRDEIIYLSPHAKETLRHFDHDAVYVIGGIVDRRQIIELSSIKCQQLGFKMLKLPTHFNGKQCKTVQSLDDVFQILYQLKFNNVVPYLFCTNECRRLNCRE